MGFWRAAGLQLLDLLPDSLSEIPVAGPPSDDVEGVVRVHHGSTPSHVGIATEDLAAHDDRSLIGRGALRDVINVLYDEVYVPFSGQLGWGQRRLPSKATASRPQRRSKAR